MMRELQRELELEEAVGEEAVIGAGRGAGDVAEAEAGFVAVCGPCNALP